MFAGAFGNTSTPSVYLCSDPTCTQVADVPTLDAWSQSVKFVMPSSCQPPTGCTFQICSGPLPNGPCTIVNDPNSPDIWWATSFPPTNLPGTSYVPQVSASGPTVLVNPPIANGPPSILRVFGRSLAFTGQISIPSSLTCIPSTNRQASTTTALILTPTSGPILPDNATCYELSFDVTNFITAGTSYPNAVIQTPWGTAPLPILVAPVSDAGPVLKIISVDTDANGNITNALTMAENNLPGYSLVVLGAHPYSLNTPLLIPANTVLTGTNPTESVLLFNFSNGVTGAITGNSSNWGINSFTIVITAATPGTPVVTMLHNTNNFTAWNMNITMIQFNVSNAFRIEGSNFDIYNNYIEQAGVCLWPPTDDNTNFQASVTLYMENAQNGAFRSNTLLWHCSAFDMDIVSRIIFEDNTITCTDPGVIPHGNSISFYNYAMNPENQGIFYGHNIQSRPANNNRTDWAFHETVTTDGPGGYGAGKVTGVNGDVVYMEGLLGHSSPVGATAIVVAGPGVGQYRAVVNYTSNISVTLNAPFDAHVEIGESVVAVVATVGSHIISGNSFTWGSVVQAFGVWITGLFVDNTFMNQNNAFADSGAIDGSLTGFGLCYGDGPQSLFYAEYTGNNMTNSNGISLHDNSPDQQCNNSFVGPYIRWVVVRNNTIGGVAASNPGSCGTVNSTNSLTTDIVSERNVFDCPPGNALYGNGSNIYAQHSIVN